MTWRKASKKPNPPPRMALDTLQCNGKNNNEIHMEENDDDITEDVNDDIEDVDVEMGTSLSRNACDAPYGDETEHTDD